MPENSVHTDKRLSSRCRQGHSRRRRTSGDENPTKHPPRRRLLTSAEQLPRITPTVFWSKFSSAGGGQHTEHPASLSLAPPPPSVASLSVSVACRGSGQPALAYQPATVVHFCLWNFASVALSSSSPSVLLTPSRLHLNPSRIWMTSMPTGRCVPTVSDVSNATRKRAASATSTTRIHPRLLRFVLTASSFQILEFSLVRCFFHRIRSINTAATVGIFIFSQR